MLLASLGWVSIAGARADWVEEVVRSDQTAATPSAHARMGEDSWSLQPIWICKKRSRQVYNAFYRTEITQDVFGNFRFEYGVGDKLQIYELYFAAVVLPVTPPQKTLARYESRIGEQPQVVIEIKEVKKKVRLEFSVTPVGGKPEFRDDYLCDSSP